MSVSASLHVDQKRLSRLLHFQSVHDHLVGIPGADENDHHGDAGDQHQKKPVGMMILAFFSNRLGFCNAIGTTLSKLR